MEPEVKEEERSKERGRRGGQGEREEAASTYQAGGGQCSMPFSEGLSCVWCCAGHQNPVSLFSGPHAPSWEWPAKSRDR